VSPDQLEKATGQQFLSSDAFTDIKMVAFNKESNFAIIVKFFNMIGLYI